MSLLLGHRGLSARYLENSMEAFRAALEAGMDGFELDVQPTRDGVAMVLHDETLDRTHHQPGRVADRSAEDLGRIGIPTLAEVVKAFGRRVAFDIELKSHGEAAVRQIRAEIRGSRIRPGWIVTSFDRATTAIAGRARLPTGFLFSTPRGDEIGLAQEIGSHVLVVRHTGVSPGLLRSAHRFGIFVWAWTLDDEPSIERVLRGGVDGVASNFPERAQQIRDRIERS